MIRSRYFLRSRRSLPTGHWARDRRILRTEAFLPACFFSVSVCYRIHWRVRLPILGGAITFIPVFRAATGSVDTYFKQSFSEPTFWFWVRHCTCTVFADVNVPFQTPGSNRTDEASSAYVDSAAHLSVIISCALHKQRCSDRAVMARNGEHDNAPAFTVRLCCH